MIFTIGYKVNYRKWLRRRVVKGTEFKKLGRRKGYSGGSVWRTAIEVFAHIQKAGDKLIDYGVFAVQADWEMDTEPNKEGNPWNDLLVTSNIVEEIFENNVSGSI